jgi:hypothetical protein
MIMAGLSISAEDIYREYYTSPDTPAESQIIELVISPLALIVVDETNGEYFSVPVIVSGDECTFGAPVPVTNQWSEHPDPESVPAPALGPSTPDDGAPLAARAGGRRRTARRGAPRSAGPAAGQDITEWAAATGRIRPQDVAARKRERSAAIAAAADPAATARRWDEAVKAMYPALAAVPAEPVNAAGPSEYDRLFPGGTAGPTDPPRPDAYGALFRDGQVGPDDERDQNRAEWDGRREADRAAERTAASAAALLFDPFDRTGDDHS